MMGLLRAIPIAILCAGGVLLAGCKSPPPKPPPPLKVSLSFSASAQVNPDAHGEPSPVVVRWYQLKDGAAFNGADFFALYDKDQATLGAALVARDEHIFAPGEHVTVDLQVSPDTHVIGVVAAYRDIRNAEWRAEIGAADKDLAGVLAKKTLNIAIDRARLSLSAN